MSSRTSGSPRPTVTPLIDPLPGADSFPEKGSVAGRVAHTSATQETENLPGTRVRGANSQKGERGGERGGPSAGWGARGPGRLCPPLWVQQQRRLLNSAKHEARVLSPNGLRLSGLSGNKPRGLPPPGGGGWCPTSPRACAQHLQRSPLKRHVPGTSEREPVPGVPRRREGRLQGKSCRLGSGGALALTDPIAQGRHYPPPPATEPPQRPPRGSPLCLDPLPHASCGFVNTDGGLSIGSDNPHLVCLRLCPGLLRQRLSGSPGEVLSTPRPSLKRSST